MFKLALVVWLAGVAGAAHGSPLSTNLADAELRGEATFRLFGLPLYRARLFTSGGAAFDWQQDFALELNYQRNIGQRDLVTATLREMKRQGGALPIAEQLGVCFSDVKKGDRYMAISDGSDAVNFWLNGRRMCTLNYRRSSTDSWVYSWAITPARKPLPAR